MVVAQCKNTIYEKVLLCALSVCTFFYSAVPTHASEIGNRMAGRIVLQVEQHGEAWYINPTTQKRHYLGRPNDAFLLMRQLSIGITNADLRAIPKPNDTWEASPAVLARVQGKILLQVEKHGEAWYVNPANNRRYYLGRPDDAFALMSNLGEGIATDDLMHIDPAVKIESINVSSGTVTILNDSVVDYSVTGWKLVDDAGVQYRLRRSKPLRAGSSMQVTVTRNPDWDIHTSHITLWASNQVTMDRISTAPAAEVSIPVPFMIQAPTGNWNLPFSEACEEAVMIMLRHYRDGVDITTSGGEQEIRELVDWEQATYGYNQDTSAAVTAETMQNYYNFDTTLAYDISAEKIRRSLRKGNPVAVPVYGKALHNPYYLNGGPDYHMVLIIGYTPNGFITHDSGTRHGNQYFYSEATMMEAIHDLTIPESNGMQGRSAMISIEL